MAITPYKPLSNTDAAYIAGIMDGEGCFMLSRYRNRLATLGFQYKPLIELVMCDADTMFYIARATDMPVSQRIIKSGRTTFKIVWHNNKAGDLARDLLPYLRGKRDQAELMLHYIDNISPGRGRAFTEAMVGPAEDIRTRLQDLKKPFALRC